MFQGDYVYIAHWEQLKELKHLPSFSICVGGGKEYITRLSEQHCNGMGLDRVDCPETRIGLYPSKPIGGGGVDLCTLYDEVNAVFEMYNQAEHELLTAIIHNAELSDVLTIADKIMGNPIWLVDAGLRLIAHSNDMEKCADQMACEALKTGISSSRAMDIAKENNVLTLLNTSRNAIFVDFPPVTPYYSMNIFDGNNRIATLTVHCFKLGPDEYMVSLLEHLAGILANVIRQKYSAQYLRSTQLQKLVMDMLGGIEFDPKMIEHTIVPLQWNINDEYQVIVVRMDRRDRENGVVKYTSESIQAIFPDSVIVELDNSHLILFHCNGSGRLDELNANRFSQFLSKRNCKAGLGMPFTNIALLRAHYKLANAALEKGESLDPDKRLYCYTSYIVPHIIDLCAQSIDVRALCHPDAIKIFQYDLKNNSDLLKSLYFYLISEKSLTAASKLLNIHRNTLVYRLTRISDLFPVNLDDPYTRLHLIASYTILRHYNDTAG
ncbi:MAG: helix-turn-helix domain-containing protein [Treponema sp.]|nr:helix-turn-helix domain-containing protein [Treponema sp.]